MSWQVPRFVVASEFPLFRGSPAEKVIVAVVGTNGPRRVPGVDLADAGRGGLVTSVMSTSCDRNARLPGSTELSGKKPKGFKDVRKLLEEKDLDAVFIATPDHWHAPAALLAAKAGKHVYVEKPCSHNPAEGEMLVKAAEKYNRYIQIGTQRRSWPGVNEAIAALKDGVIGRPYFAKGWYANNRKTIGTGKVVPVPSTLDFELVARSGATQTIQEQLDPL